MLNDNGGTLEKSTVIPAQAGIQSFSRVCGDMNLFFHAPRVKGWIPASAGMTALLMHEVMQKS